MKQKISKSEKAEQKQEKKSWNEMVKRLKPKGAIIELPATASLIFPPVTRVIIALFILCSCSKQYTQPDQPIHKYAYTATLTVTPSSKTLYYDLFATTVKNAAPGYWLWIGRINKSDIRNGKAAFGFNAPVVCGVTLQAGKRVYGCSREFVDMNVALDLNYNSVTINTIQ